MKNKWKAGFFVLLGSVLFVVIILVVMIMAPVEDDNLPTDKPKIGEEVGFEINTNKKDLNRIIQHYIQEEGLAGPIDYSVHLNDEVELDGSVPVFTSNLDFKLTFEPQALENGDVLLKQKSISVGALDLPVTYVLKVVRDSYNFPEWVKIQPKKEQIYVSLQEMELKSDFKVRANEFNLQEDRISFDLLVPVTDNAE
ncbi:YpmS family protein [Bacillus seohaeanensis]|jgi:uncharacterized protein YpmS|uniref:YpmS family protein n=1 Tax=Bacillus seohaeanensis TaxID=284580 RepID=A0ABW5RPG5_9BACI